MSQTQLIHTGGAMICDDISNIVANRIGVFILLKIFRLMDMYHLDVETTDILTGSGIGNSKTSALRFCDLIGIDTLVHSAYNIYEHCQQDECRHIFQIPPILQRMMDAQMYGNKNNLGFYQQKEEKTFVLNLATFQYQEPKNVVIPEVSAIQNVTQLDQRIRILCTGNSKAACFCRELILSTAVYSLNRLGEIAYDLESIDHSMKLFSGYELGPIEILDIFGIKFAMEGLAEFSIPVPPILERIMQTTKTITAHRYGYHFYFDVRTDNWKIASKK